MCLLVVDTQYYGVYTDDILRRFSTLESSFIMDNYPETVIALIVMSSFKLR